MYAKRDIEAGEELMMELLIMRLLLLESGNLSH
jgi:hypothetical protein